MDRKIETVFGQVVRRYREKLGVSQEAFADLAEIHRTYVSSIERGKVQVSIGIAHRVALTLGVPLSRIWADVERELNAGEKSSRKKPRSGEA